MGFKKKSEIGAGGLQDGWFDLAGFGRQALAYPEFANVILSNNEMDEQKCCVNCYCCYKLMDPGHTQDGCIVRDRESFYPLYEKYVLNN